MLEREVAMTSKDDSIPQDVREAFEQAAKAFYAWDSSGGDEPSPARGRSRHGGVGLGSDAGAPFVV
jgi:hypothetical protein